MVSFGTSLKDFGPKAAQMLRMASHEPSTPRKVYRKGFQSEVCSEPWFGYYLGPFQAEGQMLHG